MKKESGLASSSVSERTVGRIESVASFRARAGRGKTKRRTRHPYAKRKPRTYTAQKPRDMIQVDTLTVTLGPGEVVKHLSAIDLFTRLFPAEVHTRATAHLAAGFLAYLVTKPPSPSRPFR